MPAFLIAASLAVFTPAAVHPHRHCAKTFTGPMITRAVDAVYRGTRDVPARGRANLRRYVHCARNVRIRPRMHRYWAKAIAAWRLRRNPPPPPLSGPVLASYYDSHGVGACGLVGDVQDYYAVATLFLPCGTYVTLCRGGTCVQARMLDRGPYVAGRTFDLTEPLRAALGCGGLCSVYYRLS